MKKRHVIALNLFLTILLIVGIRSMFLKNPALQGETMGTTYQVKISGYVPRLKKQHIAQQINSRLEELDRQMSTWRSDSEISRFNASNGDQATVISPDFSAVLIRALEFGESTGWAFDPTLQPLLNIWGFGSASKEDAMEIIPELHAVSNALALTGPNIAWIEDATNLWKQMPEVQLELSAIAKGYGVDQIGDILDQNGLVNWFVEIGGEVSVHGHNPDGHAWRIGIQYPSTNLINDRIQGVISLQEGSIATSGDYRNFMPFEGRIYSHILDPRSGYAVLSDIASVTVSAPACMDADAIATALSVMELEEGIEWIEAHPEAEALFLIRNEQGAITETLSSGFANRTDYTPEPATP